MRAAKYYHLFAIVTVLSTLAVGCIGGGSSEPPGTSTTSTAPTASPPDSGATGAADTSGADEDTTDSRIRESLEIPAIQLLTPEAGGSARPELAWKAIDGAFLYNVVLLDSTGSAYWSWEGATTAVHVGGEPVIKEGLSGPSVIDGMSWQVAAYDTDLNLIALSHQQPIAP